jgi:hypothetical protein
MMPVPVPVPATALYGAVQEAVLALAGVLPAARTSAWRQAFGEDLATNFDPVVSALGPCPAPDVVDGGGALLRYHVVVDLCVRAAVAAGCPFCPICEEKHPTGDCSRGNEEDGS